VVTIPSEFSGIKIVAVDLNDASLPYRVFVALRPPNLSSSDNVILFSALGHLAANCARFREI